MNIWSLNKDIEVKNLLLRLESNAIWNSLQVIFCEEEDFRSIRLSSSNSISTQLYIYCYGQIEDHYGVHIEFPNINENNYGDILEIYENINFEQLTNLIEINLGSL